MLVEKCIAISTFIKKKKKETNFTTVGLEKEEIKPKISSRKRIMKTRIEIYDIENSKAIKISIRSKVDSLRRKTKLTNL